jgi:hypothetical protein
VLNQRLGRNCIVPFALCIRAVPPSLRVLFQADDITRRETNILEHTIVNEVKYIRAKSLHPEAKLVRTRVLNTKMHFRILKEPF